uniref:EF-hand domain-containing protein n=1 Tax=Elaeophora elaphi TaxID=1147741 RepID=A0A0R3S720_9BILA
MDNIVIEPEKLFDSCDQDRKGYLIPCDLQAVCPQLDDEEINFIFTTLDSDGSGRIDREEFLGGFQNALCHGENHGYPGIKRRASIVEINRKTVDVPSTSDVVHECLAESNDSMVMVNKSVGRTQEETYRSVSGATSVVDFNLPCQDEILQLYEKLQSTGMPKALSCFEKIVVSFCKEIQEQRDQNVQLQHAFESEREAYNRHMNEVENEIDQHITEIQQRAREEERKKLSHEKEEIRCRLEGEVTELRTNITKMKMMVKKAGTSRSEPANQVKHKLQNLSQENEVLKSKLAETHFELAIIKSELAIVRTDYESKKEEMSNDSKALFENARQADNLQRQLKLL